MHLTIDLAHLGGEPILDEGGHEVAVLPVPVVHPDDRVVARARMQVGVRVARGRRRAPPLRLRCVGPIAEGSDVLHEP